MRSRLATVGGTSNAELALCMRTRTRLTFEHALLLINELARGELLQLGACRTCRGVILLDRLSTGRRECVFCSTRVESNEPMAVLDKLPELLGDRGKEFVDRRALREHLRDQRVRVAPTHATPHQLSLLSECSDLDVTTVENQREHVTTAMLEDSECSIFSSQRNHPGQESATRAMASRSRSSVIASARRARQLKNPGA
jgi:hypothetical protein